MLVSLSSQAFLGIIGLNGIQSCLRLGGLYNIPSIITPTLGYCWVVWVMMLDGFNFFIAHSFSANCLQFSQVRVKIVFAWVERAASQT